MRIKKIQLGKNSFNIHYRDSTDESVIEEVLIDQDYKMCQRIIKDAHSTIIDIGAHIGTFELYVRSLNHHVPMLAFEPASDNFELLEENIRENKLQNVTAFSSAIAGEMGEAYLNLSTNNHNNSIVEPYAKDAKRSKVIHALSLGDVFTQNEITHCSLLKVDCEGAEYEIFENTSPETFTKINAIFMEYHEHFGRKHVELTTIFEKNGFTIKHIQKSKYTEDLGMILAVRY